ncbi:MAG: RNA 3'-terminal phosphate cyclase [Candidatus Bilamarchaeaceae archaeon]
MITIDGSEGEGGGQIIRTALSLAVITKKPFIIENIRAKRPNPGLQPQHLAAVKAVRSICRGKIDGAELKSTKFYFQPSEIIGGRYTFDIGTAGSVVLVAQTVIPILLFAKKPSVVKIIGGTHVMKSPSFDYFEKVFLPAINMMGANVKAKMYKAGFYPAGGGEIEIEVIPSNLEGKTKWNGDKKIRAIITIGKLDDGIAIREKKIFVQNGIEEIYIRRHETVSPGNAVIVWRDFCGAYVLGEKGKRAEMVAQEAVDSLKKENGEVDHYLADQLLLYGMLASGKTTYITSAITEHLKTNATIAKTFIERDIKIREETKKIEIE